MNEITKNLKCLMLRNGVEIWAEAIRFDNLSANLQGSQKIGFVKIDDNLVNAADIVGIFTPEAMEALTRRKNGQWKCSYEYWHDRNNRCDCATMRMGKVCGRCLKSDPDGYVMTAKGAILCTECYEKTN